MISESSVKSIIKGCIVPGAACCSELNYIVNDWFVTWDKSSKD